jgi:hypothetical protein
LMTEVKEAQWTIEVKDKRLMKQGLRIT